MVKWDLILSEKVFFYYYHSYSPFERSNEQYQYRALRDIFDQHHIVFTNSLRDAYEEFFFDNAIDEWEILTKELDLMPSYEDNNGFVFIMQPEMQKDTIENELVKIADSSDLLYPLIVCDSENVKNIISSISKKANKATILINKVLDNSIFNVIKRNTSYPAFCVYTKDNKEIAEYKKWIAEVFSNENKICIVDPYIFNERGTEALISLYIPSICENSQIDIYAQIKHKTSNLKQRKCFIDAIKKKKIKLQIYDVPFDPEEDFHERRLYLKNSQIHIHLGRGFDFINEKRKKLGDCNITINNDIESLTDFKNTHKSVFYSIDAFIGENETLKS